VLYDDMGASPEDVYALTYKLTYLYYNFSGPVKIPAPVKYADKMANLLGERGNIMPHKHFENLNSLYYI
jgi:aubergine-like protein